MRKILYLLACTAFSFLSAKGTAQVRKLSKEKIPTTIAVRLSYFWPESQRFRHIYHNGGIDYQLTGTVPVYQGDCFALRGLNFWWAVDYFKREGKSIGLGNKTNIQMEPLTAGLKWIYPKSFFRPYFGSGFKYYFVQIHNHSPYVQSHMKKNGLGFVVETGFQMFLAKYFMLDVFLSYSFKQFSSSGVMLDVGGLNTGGGLGVKF